MDKERAKFVLKSFRPDGADSQDGDFAEALLMATEDRELGGWLIRERAFDAEFAEALARVDLPEGLRESVLLAMVQDGNDFPKVDMEAEGKWIGALASIEVPVGLRERVLEAMERTVIVEKSVFPWRRLGIPLAAAAGIALAFVFVSPNKSNLAPVAETDGRVLVEAVQAGFVRAFESPIFSLDENGREMPKLISYLRKNGLPCGEGYLPPGLKNCKGLGCRELMIDGKRGTLICFDDENGTVHLVIFKRGDVEGNLPGMDNPNFEQTGNWAKASWQKGEYVFSLMGLRDEGKLTGFF
jgi:hypothetical protein